MAPPLGSRNPLYSREGIILLLGLQYAPLVFLTLRAGLRALPKELIEAGLAAGASPLTVLRTVVLPLMTPPLVAGIALCFVSSLGNFGIPAFLGIPGNFLVLPTLIYQRLAGLGPVSYTHLDVYKRQPRKRSRNGATRTRSGGSRTNSRHMTASTRPR